jgi:hypothetical protein
MTIQQSGACLLFIIRIMAGISKSSVNLDGTMQETAVEADKTCTKMSTTGSEVNKNSDNIESRDIAQQCIRITFLTVILCLLCPWRHRYTSSKALLHGAFGSSFQSLRVHQQGHCSEAQR